MAARGRPSKKTPELCAEIVERIANGEPLAAICRDEHMPDWRKVYDWRDADPEFSAAIARARDHGFDVIAADALAIADEEPEYATTEGGSRVDTGEVAHRKLRIETRLKLLAKWSPRYADRTALVGDPSNPVHHAHNIDLGALSPDQLRALASIPIKEK